MRNEKDITRIKRIKRMETLFGKRVSTPSQPSQKLWQAIPRCGRGIATRGYSNRVGYGTTLQTVCTILLLFGFATSVHAASYGEMQNQAESYVPAFYTEAVKNAEAAPAGAPEMKSADVQAAKHALDMAMQRMRENAVKNKNKTPDAIVRGMLPQTILNEWEAARAATRDGMNKFLGGGSSLDKLLAAAVAFSPSVESAAHEYEAALNRYSQSESLNQLVYKYMDFTESLNVIATPQKNKRMVQMDWPAPGMITLQGRAVDLDVAIARKQFQAAVRDAITDVKLAYADLLYLDQALAIVRENRGVARRVNKVVTSLYSTGAAAYQDMVKSEIRMDTLSAMEHTLAQKRGAAESRIIDIAGLPRDVALGKPGALAAAPAAGREALRAAAMAHRQELSIMELKIARMDVMIEMSDRKLFPDYSLGLSAYQNREIESLGQQGAMPAFAVRPMGPGAAPTYSPDKSYVLELKDKRAAAARRLDDMRNRTAADVDRLFADQGAAAQAAHTYRNAIIPKTHNAYEAALAAYMSNAGGFVDLMDAVRLILDQRMAYEDALRNARKATAQLEQITGGPPPNASSKGADAQ